jgi:hypothetical protein
MVTFYGADGVLAGRQVLRAQKWLTAALARGLSDYPSPQPDEQREIVLGSPNHPRWRMVWVHIAVAARIERGRGGGSTHRATRLVRRCTFLDE